MSAAQVGIRVPLGRPIPELADFAVRCEQAGPGGVGVPDHHHTGRGAYLTLAAMAMATSRMTVFPATSNVVTRHPLVLASLINSLDELAPGRVMLTVAPGFPERLLRAHDELSLRQVFLFPTHTWADHYKLPRAEVEAFGEVIGPALNRRRP